MVYHSHIFAFCENNKPQIATNIASVLIWLYIVKSGKVTGPFQKRHFARTVNSSDDCDCTLSTCMVILPSNQIK